MLFLYRTKGILHMVYVFIVTMTSYLSHSNLSSFCHRMQGTYWATQRIEWSLGGPNRKASGSKLLVNQWTFPECTFWLALFESSWNKKMTLVFFKTESIHFLTYFKQFCGANFFKRMRKISCGRRILFLLYI